MTGSMENERRVDVIYLDFSKALSTVSYSTLVSKMKGHSLAGWTTSWVKKLVGYSGSEGYS